MKQNGKVKGRWLGKISGGFAAALLAMAFLGAGPVETARADGFVSFGFGTSFGHGHRHYRHGHRHYRYRHYKHRRYGHRHYRHSHVTYTKVVPAAPVRPVEPAEPAAAKDARQACLMVREYQTKITVGGKEVDAYGDACMQPDGSWRLGVPKQVPAS